jgi:hypothetical protein
MKKRAERGPGKTRGALPSTGPPFFSLRDADGTAPCGRQRPPVSEQRKFIIQANTLNQQKDYVWRGVISKW